MVAVRCLLIPRIDFTRSPFQLVWFKCRKEGYCQQFQRNDSDRYNSPLRRSCALQVWHVIDSTDESEGGQPDIWQYRYLEQQDSRVYVDCSPEKAGEFGHLVTTIESSYLFGNGNIRKASLSSGRNGFRR